MIRKVRNLKAGECVKLVYAPGISVYNIYTGQIGIVTEASNEEHTAEIRFSDGHTRWVWHDELRRVPKWVDVYSIQQYTGSQYRWEEVTTEATYKEAMKRLQEYRDNQPGYPARCRRVKVINPEWKGT